MSLRYLSGLLLFLLAGAAAAHTLSVAHVDVTANTSKGGAVVDVDLALRDLALTIPLDLDGDNAITWSELSTQQPALESLITKGVILSAPSGSCTLHPRVLGIRNYDGIPYAGMEFTTDCNVVPGMTVRYDLIFEQDPAHRVLLAWRTGTAVQTDILHAGNRSSSMGSTGSGNNGSNTFLQFLNEGVHHILGGLDHLAFLLALLLPAVLVWHSGQWKPAARVVDSLRSVAGIVTAFTLAHSVTLSMAALGVIHPSARMVEVVIALSVLVAAVNNIRPVITGRVWVVALVFGLIHGLGFARALQDLGLPKGQELLALVGFNLGVEMGQLSVVVLVFPVLASLRRQPWYPRIAMPALSVLIALAALYWISQRIGI
jgi:hypothetical protein